MTQAHDLARQTLLEAPGLTETALSQVMDKLLSRQLDAADIYFQYSRLESWVLDDGIIKEGNHSIEQGAGLRKHTLEEESRRREFCLVEAGVVLRLFSERDAGHLSPQISKRDQGKKFQVFSGSGSRLVGVLQSRLSDLSGRQL